MVQYGFYFDQGRCTACQACSVICKDWNNLPPGPVKWMRVYQWENGTFPNIDIRTLAIPCYHCENPVCIDACARFSGGAIYKEEKYGTVLIDPDKCDSLRHNCNRACWRACPYGSIVFPSDDLEAKAQKCTMCIDRLEQGFTPICVLSCGTRALEFGPIEDLRRKYGNRQELKGMPPASITTPAAVFKAPLPKKKIVTYDYERALDLWQQRGPYASPGLPMVFESKNDVSSPEGYVARRKLALKVQNVREFMFHTTNDE